MPEVLLVGRAWAIALRIGYHFVLRMTAADVQRVAKKYVPYDNVQIVAVGDGAKIREALKKFGPVTETTVDGN